jgi:hypothetical protein
VNPSLRSQRAIFSGQIQEYTDDPAVRLRCTARADCLTLRIRDPHVELVDYLDYH